MDDGINKKCWFNTLQAAANQHPHLAWAVDEMTVEYMRALDWKPTASELSRAANKSADENNQHKKKIAELENLLEFKHGQVDREVALMKRVTELEARCHLAFYDGFAAASRYIDPDLAWDRSETKKALKENTDE